MKSVLLVAAGFVVLQVVGGALQEYGRHFAAYTVREAPWFALRLSLLLAALGARLGPRQNRAERAEEYASHLLERTHDSSWQMIRDGFGFVIAGIREPRPQRQRTPAPVHEPTGIRTALRRAIALSGLTAVVVVSGSIAAADGVLAPTERIANLDPVRPTVINVDRAGPASTASEPRLLEVTRVPLRASESLVPTR